MTLSCSAVLSTEDGCGHAGTAGHSDAGPAPGSWEVGVGGKGPLGKERVLSPKGGGSWLPAILVAPFPFFLPLFQVGNLGLLFMLLFFIFCSSGRGALWSLGELGWGGAEGARAGDSGIPGLTQASFPFLPPQV